jgi:molybdate/tungstate transport system substrate-binding protein
MVVAGLAASRFLNDMILADTLVIFLAASLTKPMQPTLDAFRARTGIVIQRESGASLEHVRKITELHRIPDVVLLADADVISQLLVPAHATWYADFARNRMVVAYTDRSRFAKDITPDNWMQVVRRPGVEVGRTDPDLAPVGYRTLLMFQLAERYYGQRALASSLLDHSPQRNMRPNAAELAALLEAGELDYIYDYQSVAESNAFRFIALPDAINLADPAHAANYASASVSVRGTTPGTTAIFTGQPILYGLTVPKDAPHAAAAARFLEYLMSPETLRALHKAHVDMLDHPVVHGTGAPPELTRGGPGL